MGKKLDKLQTVLDALATGGASLLFRPAFDIQKWTQDRNRTHGDVYAAMPPREKKGIWTLFVPPSANEEAIRAALKQAYPRDQILIAFVRTPVAPEAGRGL